MVNSFLSVIKLMMTSSTWNMLQHEVELQEELVQRKMRWVSRMIIWGLVRMVMRRMNKVTFE